MKNLFLLFFLTSLFVACSNNDNTSTSVPSSTTIAEHEPMARPAAVKAAPEETTDTKGVASMDELPETPKSAEVEKGMDKSDKAEMAVNKDNLKVKAEKKITKAVDNMKEEAEDAKNDVDRRIEAEKKKLEEMQEKVKDKMAFSHKPFDKLLQKYVSSMGKVNYAGLKKDHAQLKAYIKALEGQSIDKWKKEKKMAYWINAYNANTINLILDNYPVKSINDIAGGKPFDKKIATLDGKSLSLNDIENTIIRPQFKDARIHFAVNCAAKSCPPLWHRAWTEDNLNTQLDEQTKSFVNNPNYNTIKTSEVMISKIFDWYKDDFSNIQKFLDDYSDTDVAKDAKVGYKEYDWALNE